MPERSPADPELREDYRQHRPTIERTTAQVATPQRAADQAALPRHRQEQRLLKRRTAELNLRNLLGRGLTRAADGWGLAT